MNKNDKQGKSRVYVSNAEFSRIEVHCYSELLLEVGGFLVGEIKDGDTRVVASIPALKANSQQISLTFTHEVWEDALQTVARDYEGLSIVGWYHTHPSFGLFLSEYDTFIQKNFFSASGQVALVVDPIAGTFAWFAADGRSKEPKIVHQGSTKTGAKPRVVENAKAKIDTVRFVVSIIASATMAALVTWALTTMMMPEDAGNSNWKNRAMRYQADLSKASEIFEAGILQYTLGAGESIADVLHRFYGPETPEFVLELNGWTADAIPELEEGALIYLVDVPRLVFPGITYSELEDLVHVEEAEPTPSPSATTPAPTPTSTDSESDS